MIYQNWFGRVIVYACNKETTTLLITRLSLMKGDYLNQHWSMILVSNYIDAKEWGLITHSCINFNSGIVKPPLQLGHGWAITSHRNCGSITFPWPWRTVWIGFTWDSTCVHFTTVTSLLWVHGVSSIIRRCAKKIFRPKKTSNPFVI